MNIDEFIDISQDKIRNTISHLFNFSNKKVKSLNEAALYILNTGKKIRPILVLAIVQSFHQNIEKALIPACALELVHSYSLVHDDLPCMDNDDYRRGKPTVHKKYSEWLALLTGDFLLTHAFSSISSSILLSDREKVLLIKYLSKKASANGMIGGQVVDLESTNKTINFETLYYMHSKKTSALFETAAIFGAIICKTNFADTKNLLHFAKNIGLAFQFADDVLDRTSPCNVLGKKNSSDQKNKKTTAINVLGFEKAKTYAKKYYQKAIKSLDNLSVQSDLLKDLTDRLIQRKF